MAEVRVLKVIQQFDSLHLLLGSIRASFDILAWQLGRYMLHVCKFPEMLESFNNGSHD